MSKDGMSSGCNLNKWYFKLSVIRTNVAVLGRNLSLFIFQYDVIQVLVLFIQLQFSTQCEKVPNISKIAQSPSAILNKLLYLTFFHVLK